MKFYILMAALVVATAVLISDCYDHFSVRRVARRERKKLLAELAALPPVAADFSTPEGAVLCLEETYRRRDLEAAVACRDFVSEAKLWLQERGHLSQQQKEEMLPQTVKAMEKSFRDLLAKGPTIDWARAKSYFLPREPYGEGLVIVSKVTQEADGSLFSQRILLTETGDGWRIVKLLS
jgi:hypothetical protein